MELVQLAGSAATLLRPNVPALYAILKERPLKDVQMTKLKGFKPSKVFLDTWLESSPPQLRGRCEETPERIIEGSKQVC